MFGMKKFCGFSVLTLDRLKVRDCLCLVEVKMRPTFTNKYTLQGGIKKWLGDL